MSQACSRCECQCGPADVYCKRCGAKLADFSFEGGSIENKAIQVRFCSQCGQESVPGTTFCAQCGAEIQDVDLGMHNGESHSKVIAPPSSNADRIDNDNFSWVWFFKSFGIIFLTSFIAGIIILGILFMNDFEVSGGGLLIISLLGMAGIFGGSYIAALRSPGKTIREPAFAAAAISVITSLNSGEDLIQIVFGAALLFFVGLIGAKMGEKQQARQQA